MNDIKIIENDLSSDDDEYNDYDDDINDEIHKLKAKVIYNSKKNSIILNIILLESLIIGLCISDIYFHKKI